QPAASEQHLTEPHARFLDLGEGGVELLRSDQAPLGEDPAEHRPHLVLEVRVVEPARARDPETAAEGCGGGRHHPVYRTERGGGVSPLRGAVDGQNLRVIDLRSDTATRPTAEMRAAMAAAEVGDEQLREDPTVNELQRRAAELLGHEAALFLPTATMANQIALKVLTRPGCLLLAEERTHVLVFEAGGPAVHSGLVMRGLPGVAGRLVPEQLREVVATSEDVEPASVVVLENTHRSAGGRVWPLAELERVVQTARELGLAVHLDGARLLNAAVASGVPPAKCGRLADTVTVCFSKGLGCPLGAVLACSRERMEAAWAGKFLFGGAMRQAGIV